ncbi:pentatricopeptide repeat-containing protein At4g02750-like [Zingiber officinale]|uniref:Pentatricopeptide repeat-containing protein n=1 Tax=Zingiber officinale TaxID=94328 RepID=A0A8J5HSB9_ZINOF|nr:pentatricopeptide repeat-containing protein At4g02750-like [Zingiber officinale]KAG6523894.1 hypothetical protein ZIOFF_013781 [Zingiber officinale]
MSSFCKSSSSVLRSSAKPRPRTLSPSELFHHNRRIASLGRTGQLHAARQLFDEMPIRDTVSWNAILTAHWHNSDLDGSKRLFQTMPHPNTVSWNSLITGCFHNGRPQEALHYFLNMPCSCRNVASWNTTISGLVRYEHWDIAERLFLKMPAKNVISYTAMIDGLARRGEVDRARNLFDRMPKRNTVSWGAIISGYGENGLFEEARTLFNRMPEKNLVAITTVITGYCKQGRVDKARELFDGIQHKDLICWNAMLSGYVHNDHPGEALKLFIQLLETGMKPDHYTLIAVVKTCSSVGLLQQGRLVHAYAIKTTNWHLNVSLSNALVTMYSKGGCISDSELLFSNIHNRDLVSWNAIIAAFSEHGYQEKVVSLFNEMEEDGITPDDITFLSILSALGRAANIKDSLNWFSLMISKYGIQPKAEHYASVVDALCRAGHLEKACKYMGGMPLKARNFAWSAILAACQTNSHVELGESAAKKLLVLDSENSGAYVALSNIYAEAGMWREVTKVRAMMRQNRVKKQPGYSWTEISGNIHLFLVGDASHSEIDKILREPLGHSLVNYHIIDL